MQKLELIRFANFSDRTLGLLRYEYGKDAFYTIERPWLYNAPNISCIPAGTYVMRRFYDVHGYRSSKAITEDYVWEICNVPDRTVILLHVANYARNVEGCVGLGLGALAGLQGVGNSRTAVTDFQELTEAESEMEITIREGAIS